VFYLLVSAVLSTNNNDYDHIGRERKVIESYNQGKSTRDIAKEIRMSLRDDDDDNKKSHSNNEKATHAYKLFSEGKKPVEVAMDLVNC
jgi:hypothetical protein